MNHDTSEMKSVVLLKMSYVIVKALRLKQLLIKDT
jgi:hypothetical protein